MENDKYQKELFEFEKPKRTRALRLGRIFTRVNIAITLTIERLVFISIGLIMVAVIVYAIGVERGKVIGKTAVAPIARQPSQAVGLATPSAVPQTAHKAAVALSAQQESSGAIPSEKARGGTMPYTIAAVTMSRKDAASLEANRLKREGFDAFLVQSDSYFLVCIGAYPDKDSAQSKRALFKVKQLYRDAYFKLR